MRFSARMNQNLINFEKNGSNKAAQRRCPKETEETFDFERKAWSLENVFSKLYIQKRHKNSNWQGKKLSFDVHKKCLTI